MKFYKLIIPVLFLSLISAFQIPCHAEERHAKEIAKGVYVITDFGFSNCGFIVTDEGVVVVDTTLSPYFGSEILKEIKAVTDKPVKYVINTHWHTDHVGGNEVFVPGAHIIAHEFTAKVIAQRKADQDAGKVDEQLKALGEFKFTPPDITFDNEKTLQMGDKTIELKFFGGGHTAGDIIVYLPKEKVLFSGDLFIKGSGLPDYRDDGNIDRQIASLKKMQELDIDKIVCGHLAVMSSTVYTAEKKDIQDSIDKLLAFRAKVKSYVDQNIPPEKAAEEIKFPAGENPFYKQKFSKVVIKTYNDIKNAQQ